MSLERIETMLNTAPDMRMWLATSKTLRWMKSWNKGVAQPAMMLVGLFGAVGLSFWQVSSIAPQMSIDVLSNAPMSAFGFIFLVPIGMIVANLVVANRFSKVWNRKTFFTGQREFQGILPYDTTEVKSCVIENFMRLRGEEWDALAPVLHKCIQEDGLPYLWWSDLNTHLIQNVPVVEPDLMPLQTVKVQSLEEQLHDRAQTLKHTNHSLSI